MTDADIETLVTKLRSATALGRLAHGEAKTVVAHLVSLVAAPKTGA